MGKRDNSIIYTHPVFDRRIAVEGATFAHVLSDFAARSRLEGCTVEQRCDVFRVNSGGSWDRLQELVRTVIDTEGVPTREDSVFVFDEDEFGWIGLRAFDPNNANPRSHGTEVGSVVASNAPNAAIVPSEVPIDEGLLVGTPGGETSLDYREPLLGAVLSQHLALLPLEQLDSALARHWCEYYASADIINISLGGASNPGDAFDDRLTARHMARQEVSRRWLPQRWTAYTQSDVPPSERTIVVYSATNGGIEFGRNARGLFLQEIARFPELRGHTIGVAALHGNQLAAISSSCGELPADWDASRHGRHYCLAAPALHRVPDLRRGGYREQFGATSFAAPYVSATLARMMEQFRGQIGNTELVRRLMNSADDTGVYADSTLYGAGRIDPAAALAPIGTVLTGPPGGSKAALARTRLVFPSAYGDAAQQLAGIEIATFDALNFPFWFEFSDLVDQADAPPNAIPRFDTPEATSSACSYVAALAPDVDCTAGDSSGAMLLAPDGGGASFAIQRGFVLSAHTRTGQRLDGRADGAFSWDRGSTLIALHLDRSMHLPGGIQADVHTTVAADLPVGAGSSQASMLHAGPALLSS